MGGEPKRCCNTKIGHAFSYQKQRRFDIQIAATRWHISGRSHSFWNPFRFPSWSRSGFDPVQDGTPVIKVHGDDNTEEAHAYEWSGAMKKTFLEMSTAFFHHRLSAFPTWMETVFRRVKSCSPIPARCG
jgi:hypothetical protein